MPGPLEGCGKLTWSLPAFVYNCCRACQSIEVQRCTVLGWKHWAVTSSYWPLSNSKVFLCHIAPIEPWCLEYAGVFSLEDGALAVLVLKCNIGVPVRHKVCFCWVIMAVCLEGATPSVGLAVYSSFLASFSFSAPRHIHCKMQHMFTISTLL